MVKLLRITGKVVKCLLVLSHFYILYFPSSSHSYSGDGEHSGGVQGVGHLALQRHRLPGGGMECPVGGDGGGCGNYAGRGAKTGGQIQGQCCPSFI